jgi:hypothetical protein
MRIADCRECLRLYAEYAGATLGRFKLDGQYKLAVLKRDDSEQIGELSRRLEAAEEACRQAKEKLRQHEQQEHANIST